jgi:hypothetical protein
MAETAKQKKDRLKAEAEAAETARRAALSDEERAAEDAAKKDEESDEGDSEISKVVFTRKDGTTREFNPKDHGKNFVKVADEFEQTNKLFIAKRENF